MATVKLVWQKFPTTDGDEIHRSEVKARNGKDALFMEVHARRRALIRQHIVTRLLLVRRQPARHTAL